MKIYFTLIVIMACAFLSGCATGKNGLVFDTVGPAPDQSSVANSTNGTLVVYSAYEDDVYSSSDPYRPKYSDYRIFTADGKLLQRVHNNSGTILHDPVSSELQPGKYNVIARANGYGYVTVPVMIVARENTVLHLEGDVSWPDESKFNQTNAVRLPDGRIIGWKVAANL